MKIEQQMFNHNAKKADDYSLLKCVNDNDEIN